MNGTEETPKPEEQIVIVRERFVESLLSDSVTLGMLAFLPWFNHRFCGGSGFIDAAIGFAWFVTLNVKASGKIKSLRKTPAEARAWLDEEFPA